MGGDVAVATQRIDNLSYHYNNENNRLSSITDAVTTNAIDTDDLKNQVGNNYLYDEIGNLTQDLEGKNQVIEWTAYGKVSKVVKSDGKEITYRYDATGQRISKTFEGKTTFYVRDASGNVMATYEAPQLPAGGVLKELMIYGSARVGVYNGKSERMKATLGNKNYELSNHLGNVLVTITDNKFIATVGVFVAKVNSTTDYYPFGMAIKERTWQSKEYRYGFNTQEKDLDIDKSGNHTTAEFWEYDSRSGRRWNVDPMPIECISDYATNLNCPIRFSDVLGNTPNGGGGGGGSSGVGGGQGAAAQPGQAAAQPLAPPTGRGPIAQSRPINHTSSYPVVVSDQMGFSQIVDGIGAMINAFRNRNATPIRPTAPQPKNIQRGGFLGSLTQEQVDEYEALQTERFSIISESAQRAFDNDPSKGGRLGVLRGAIHSGLGVISNKIGTSREEYVAELVGGTLAKDSKGQDIKVSVEGGSTGLDVFGRSGEYYQVGGSAKGLDIQKFQTKLSILKKAAQRDGVGYGIFLEKGTTDEVIKAAEKMLGKDNVHIFERK
jgi:YD repeat-containing protein